MHQLCKELTLCFLQDGEFLPDGPVVISPDGLFPSLYREGKRNSARALMALTHGHKLSFVTSCARRTR